MLEHMESMQLDHDNNFIEEPSLKQLILPSSPEISGIYGNPQVNPRLGHEYQVNVPPMNSDHNQCQPLVNPFVSEGSIDISHSFMIGLPIPIMWIPDKVNHIKDDESASLSTYDIEVDVNGIGKSGKSKKNKASKRRGSELKAEPLHVGRDEGKESKSVNLGSTVAGKADLDQLHKSENYSTVPGSSSDPWSDAEVDSFIFGLYVFGKNFLQIKRFMDNKEMGDILSFYYGKFYMSDEYHRWSDSRKTRRKKCVYGQKIFTGWRQQELLSRMDPHVPEHCRHIFLEISAAFKEGKLLLDDYIFKLKAIVGIQVLVDVIGIGKGKEDLTGLAMVPVKSNPSLPACPIGKACSSLTSNEIIKLLTGSFCLSKARCNDIFWEAVWPRLLARGWHSEQPKDLGFFNLRPCLVFLVPGVKKFSRRKLVKGNHYFDSVSDVLSKVASEPKLIELEDEEVRDSSCNEEDRWFPDQDDRSIQQCHRYLKPRVATGNLKLVEFTVVDSSLINGGKLFKEKSMRYAPNDLTITSLHTSLPSGRERIFLEDTPINNGVDDADMSSDGEENIKNADCSKDSFDHCGSNLTKFTIVDSSLVPLGKPSIVRELRCSPVELKVMSEVNASSRKAKHCSSEVSRDEHAPNAASMWSNAEKKVDKCSHTKGIVDNSGSNKKDVNLENTNKLVESLEEKNDVSKMNQSTRIIKHQFSRRPKSGHSNGLVPLVKRRRLTACSNTEISRVIENFSVQVSPFQEKLSSTNPSAKEGPEQGSSGAISSSNCLGMVTLRDQSAEHKPSSLMDLNLTAADSQNCEQVPSVPADVSSAAGQPNVNPRRQSTRNRPLTTRALEALECGFLCVKNTQKCTQVQPQLSSSFHKSHGKVKGKSRSRRVGSGTAGAKKGRNADEKDFVGKTLIELKKSGRLSS